MLEKSGKCNIMAGDNVDNFLTDFVQVCEFVFIRGTAVGRPADVLQKSAGLPSFMFSAGLLCRNVAGKVYKVISGSYSSAVFASSSSPTFTTSPAPMVISRSCPCTWARR